MKTKTLLFTAAAALVVAGGLTVAKLQRNDAGPGPLDHRPIIQRGINELNLSDEQIQKIRTELKAEKDTLVPMLRDLHATRKGLRETIQSGGDEAAVRAAFSKVADV